MTLNVGKDFVFPRFLHNQSRNLTLKEPLNEPHTLLNNRFNRKEKHGVSQNHDSIQYRTETQACHTSYTFL